MNNIIEPEFYTAEELSKLLNVPKRTIYKWSKRLPRLVAGRLLLFPRVEIQKRILSGKLLK
jgi:excisionase family DNA binding protein